jgi:phosphoribosylaminoimidazolecarboxamide formyltransferase/IMP cyclohydrolase
VSRRQSKRALISVYDKTGLVELARTLVANNYEIIASGASLEEISKAGVASKSVESVTGFGEILGGRVKTLHPLIHGAILADLENTEHVRDLELNAIDAIDMVVVNLYPFEKTIHSGASQEEIIENIDIGGPALLRAAAKNYKNVTVISNIDQYQLVLENIEQGFSLEQRRLLAGQAFLTTQRYESAISNWLNPERLDLSFTDPKALRYGENPHQSATIYRKVGSYGVASAELLHGKEMSFNNYLDADAAFRAVNEFNKSAVVIIKHAIPSGIALGLDSTQAYKAALDCDRVSAYGGVVGSNSIITAACASEILKLFTEVVIAPEFEVGALELFRKKADIRILKVNKLDSDSNEIRAITGGLLIQEIDRLDNQRDTAGNWQHVAGPVASKVQLEDLEFAWRAVKSVRSNAILVAKNLASIGIGAGQVNRLQSAKVALQAASDGAKGAVAASDGFFPFADGLEILIEAGVVAVVQPGGSRRDEEVIKAAKDSGVSMYFTGRRHFSH